MALARTSFPTKTPHIRLREILFLEDDQFIYRQPDPEKDWQLQKFTGGPGIVEEFFADVFNGKAGLGA